MSPLPFKTSILSALVMTFGLSGAGAAGTSSAAAIDTVAEVTFAKAAQAEIPAPPPLAEARSYLTNTETLVLKGSLREVRAFLEENPVTSFLKPTDRIPGLKGTTVLKGTWGQPGALRRVDLKDGNYVHERVLTNTDTEFSYQIWDITAPSGRFISHIYGRFEYSQEGADTKIQWSYSIKPSIFIARGQIRRFLDEDFGPFMRSGFDGLAKAYAAR